MFVSDFNHDGLVEKRGVFIVTRPESHHRTRTGFGPLSKSIRDFELLIALIFTSQSALARRHRDTVS